MAGDNRYHSIFGAVKMCLAVNPSDTAPALVALNAKIKTNKRLIEAENFWEMTVPGSTILAADEIVTEIQIPTPAAGCKSAFIKFAIRKSIDFPIVNCAAMIGDGDARICLNAVYNKPYRALKAEEAIKGKKIDEDNADAAGAAAVASAKALPGDRNKWKIPDRQNDGETGDTRLRIILCFSRCPGIHWILSIADGARSARFVSIPAICEPATC